ncbi:hypothetical protein ABH917_001552 [Thermobifida halotolerans]
MVPPCRRRPPGRRHAAQDPITDGGDRAVNPVPGKEPQPPVGAVARSGPRRSSTSATTAAHAGPVVIESRRARPPRQGPLLGESEARQEEAADEHRGTEHAADRERPRRPRTEQRARAGQASGKPGKNGVDAPPWAAPSGMYTGAPGVPGGRPFAGSPGKRPGSDQSDPAGPQQPRLDSRGYPAPQERASRYHGKPRGQARARPTTRSPRERGLERTRAHPSGHVRADAGWPRFVAVPECRGSDTAAPSSGPTGTPRLPDLLRLRGQGRPRPLHVRTWACPVCGCAGS